MKRYFILMLATVVFAAGCAQPTPKSEVIETSARIPPPIFGATTRAPNMPDDTILDVEESLATDFESKGDLTSLGDIPEKRIIYFDYDQSNIKSKYRTILEEHAAYLNQHPEISVRLEGHADERGSREYNLALGEQRADAAKEQFVMLGIFGNQLTTLSYGEERPLSFGHNETSWWRNRRVEIIYP